MILWCLASGFYAAQAIAGILADPEGWEQTGFTFEQTECEYAGIQVDISNDNPGSATALGWWSPGHIWIREFLATTDNGWFRGVVEHEFGHALCLGHEGSGLMNNRLMQRPSELELGLVAGRATVVAGTVLCRHVEGVR